MNPLVGCVDLSSYRKGGHRLSDSDKLFTGSIAAIYDRYPVPLIFERYARDMAERTASVVPDSILEIASGSGVVTRAVAEVLRSDTRYVATNGDDPPVMQLSDANLWPAPCR